MVEQLRRPVPGGIGTFAAGLLTGLDQLGPDAAQVSLLASRPPRGAPDPLTGFGRPLLTSRLPGRLLTRAWDVSLVSAPAGFDVVHALSMAFPLPERPSATRLAVSVYDLAWRHHPETSTPRGRRWHEAAFGRALRQADVLVVPSEQVAEDVRRAGAGADRVAVIVPGADHLARPDHGRRRPGSARPGSRGPTCSPCRPLEPRKNLTRLVGAYRRARDRLPEPWPLVVVGPEGWGRGSLQPTPGVALVGEVSPAELSGLYAGATLFAYVPLLEGYGLPPIEAMTFGVPTVVSRGVPSVAEAPAGVSRLVDPLDLDALAEALVEVAGSEDRRLALAAAGSKLASGRRWRTTARADGGPVGVPVSRIDRPAGRLAVSLDVSAVPARPAGAGRYTLELARALLARDDLALTLVTRRADAERWRALPSPEGRARPEIGPWAPDGRPGRLVWEQVGLPGRLRRAAVAVHHGPHYTMPERSPVPAVVTVHDCTFFDHPEWHERTKVLVFRRAIRVAARRAAVIVCVSRTTAERLHVVVDVRVPVVVAPHGVDHRRFTPAEPEPGADRRALGRLGLDPGRPRVTFIGTMEPRKGVADLVRAFDRVAPSQPDVQLVLAGQPGLGGRRGGPGPGRGGPRRPGGAHRVRPRRRRASAAALLGGGRVPLARGGLRAARPGGPGLRSSARSPPRARPWRRWPARPPCWWPRAGPTSWPRPWRPRWASRRARSGRPAGGFSDCRSPPAGPGRSAPSATSRPTGRRPGWGRPNPSGRRRDRLARVRPCAR